MGPRHPDVASTLNSLGLSSWRNKELEPARRYFERSIEVYEAALGPDHVDLTRPLRNLAGLVQHLGKLDEAEALYRRVLVIRERAFGPGHSMLAAPLARLGALELSREAPAAAEPLLRRALKLGRDKEPHRDSEVILPRLDLARALMALEHNGEAEKLLLSITGDETVLPARRYIAHKSLITLYEVWGRAEEVAPHREAIAAMQAAYGWG